MRLSRTEISAIKQTAQEVFGADVEVVLFGSRTDDHKRGGDIDWYIKAGQNQDLTHKIKFLVRLEQRIGEQKVDVVFSEDASRPSERQAKATGIRYERDQAGKAFQ
ncbi:nucleotidyltransferase domain-containing protein [Methylococcus geothermalis]|uniref:Nucleotidyltransferase domain-containing protein n=1 Tax=Methylococcus geothermalis TaxID=2681310 RepID=A0A858QAF9_9GAMM|nr:nucleotidyltransferase domain-containing protein [Methylococcus geothermalis]QJD30666.1 nucleotidyltransferase domain-containing protein [Methylococcus geothermalis]